MAIALVTNALVQGSNGGTSSSVDTTGSTLLVAMVSYQGGSTPTFSDSKGNTWTVLTGGAANTPHGKIAYVANPTVGSGHTFTISGSGTYSGAVFAAFSGAATSTPLDQQAAQGGGFWTDATAQPGSITPSEDNELVFYGQAGPAANSTSTVSGYTPIDRQIEVGGTAYAVASFYQVQTTATATNPLFVTGASGWSGSLAIASFKAAAGASNDPEVPLLNPLHQFNVHRM